MTLDPKARSTPTWVRLLLVVGLLYLFLVGVKGLESGIKAFGADTAANLFEGVSNPLAGLFVGILATVLVQSSSVTTSTIVGLVGSGLLGVGAAVPMIMGANIGTTVTNTLASLGHLRRSKEFEKAFAGATMHDFFNILSVALLLPLELATGFLSSSARWIAQLFYGRTDLAVEAPSSPIKAFVRAPVALFEAILDRMSAGDVATGVMLIVGGLAMIFLALAYITRNMRLVVAGRIEASMNQILAKGAGFGGMIVGLLMTVAVQSSSITTSILIPMVAAGVLTLRNAYPVTLGANVGTTVTALLASLAAARPEALVIALTHTLFNLTGIAVFYPIRAIRFLPVRLAERLAALAVRNRSAVFVYVLGVFVVIPLVGVMVLR